MIVPDVAVPVLRNRNAASVERPRQSELHRTRERPGRFFGCHRTPLDPFGAKARVLLELDRRLKPKDGAELLERAVPELVQAPLEQEHKDRARDQEREKEAEQEPGGKAPARIESNFQPRQELHAGPRVALRRCCMENELL